jgi:hypothetical protein
MQTTTIVSRPATEGGALAPSAGNALPKSETSLLAQVFTDHPRTVGETYRQHGKTALGFALRLLGAGLACVVHALVPCLFSRTASVTIDSLHKEMLARSPRQPREMPQTGSN